MTSAAVSQKDYLKRYLSKNKKKAKRKDKEKKDKDRKGFKIVEDSFGINDIPFGDELENEEDAPTVAEITYENETLKKLEEFQVIRSKWKRINDDENHVINDDSLNESQEGKGRNSPSHKEKDDSEVTKRKSMTTQEYLRARKAGKLKKDTEEEIAKKEREKKLQKEAQDVNEFWKHGLKQVEEFKKRIKEYSQESEKEFARNKDDIQLNVIQKDILRADDPMLSYVLKKKSDSSKKTDYPIYKGPFPMNRFNIRPGYRWDGVDRSSGFEKKWFEIQSAKEAAKEATYKWSVSDM